MSSTESIKVFIRFRPFNDRELSSNFDKENLKIFYENGNRTVHLVTKDGLTDKTFNFDYVFDDKTTQDEVYEKCGKPVMDEVLKGYNGTIFAYGQTGSGKTWTMMGPTDEQKKIRDLRGLIPRSGEHVFQFIQKGGTNDEYKISVQYLEIYRDEIQDLLDPTKVKLKIHESPTRGIFVKDLTEVYIRSLEDIYYYLTLGDHNKRMATTDMNKKSSRSHSVYTIKIMKTDTTTGTTASGKINLVDLAGSEKVRKSGAQGDRLQEAKSINRSLSALGHCINCIVEGKPHIPFRNSPLTRMLQESLGGNCKTTVVCATSPHPFNLDETVSTLGFGARAKSIKLKVKANIRMSAEELQKLVDKLEEELRKLKIKNKKLLKELSKYKQLSPEEQEELKKYEEVKENKKAYVDEDEEEDEEEEETISQLQFELKKMKCAYDNEVTSVRDEVKREQERRNEMKEDLERKEKELEEIERINKILEQGEGNFDLIKKDFIKNLKTSKQTFIEEKRRLEEENEVLQKNLEDLEEKTLMNEEELQAIKGKLITDPQERATFMSQIQSYKRQFDDIKEENTQLKSQIDELVQEQLKAQRNAFQTKEELEELAKRNKELVETRNEMEERLKEFDKDIADTEDELELLMGENEVFEENGKKLEEENQKQMEKLKSKNLLLNKMKMLLKRYNVNLGEIKKIKLKKTKDGEKGKLDVFDQDDAELKRFENQAVVEMGGSVLEADLEKEKDLNTQPQNTAQMFSFYNEGNVVFKTQEEVQNYKTKDLFVDVEEETGTVSFQTNNGTKIFKFKDGNAKIITKDGKEFKFDTNNQETPSYFGDINVSYNEGNVIFKTQEGTQVVFEEDGRSKVVDQDGTTKILRCQPVEQKIFVNKSLVDDIKILPELRKKNVELQEKENEVTQKVAEIRREAKKAETGLKNEFKKLKKEIDQKQRDNKKLNKEIGLLKGDVMKAKKKKDTVSSSEILRIRNLERELTLKNEEVSSLESKVDLKTQTFREYKTKIEARLKELEKERQEFLKDKGKYETKKTKKKTSSAMGLRALVNELFELRKLYKNATVERERLSRENNHQRRNLSAEKKRLKISQNLSSLSGTRIDDIEKELRKLNVVLNKKYKEAELYRESKEQLLQRLSDLQKKLKM